jgi:LysM repeat protein
MRRILTFGIIFTLSLALATPVCAEGSIVHIVQPGENLFRIGLRYGLTANALAAANGLRSPNFVYVGQRLTIPTGSDPAAPSTPSSSSVHIVERGENLYRIALRYGVTRDALAVANGIVNVSHIYVGQRLVIPGRGTTPSPPAPAPPGGDSGRWIDVNLSTQQLTAYQGSTPVRSTLASTGRSGTPTPTGQFSIYVKYLSTRMRGAGYDFANVPHVMFFYRGYSLHGTYWHSNFGHPMSHGCINLPMSEAEWLYNWASVGTLVNIHY